MTETSKAAVWKYTLNLEAASTTFDIPLGAQILTAREQFGNVSIWAKVDPLSAHEKRTFKAVGTGNGEVSAADSYIGTAFLYDGRLVIHVFEVKL